MNDLIQIVQQNWSGWGQTVVALGAAAVVWVLSRVQSMGEIRKLQAELVSLRVSQFEKIIALDEKQRGIVARMHDQLRALLSAVQGGDAASASAAREAVSKMFLLEYIGSYFHYASLGRWIFPEARHELADDEMLPFLETSAMIVGVLNQPNVLSLTGQSPLKVNGFDFNFAFRFVRQHTRLWERGRKRKLAGAGARVGDLSRYQI